ncbi:hypothetical protein PHYBLDRAFT_152562 [Phycomyces blakesleeanus NRRL 1555(-)]|uniref:Uncharacterized protein n=1 Tax=Phycomyces blakesleeanus (strain ATCC 8743b / DSM 1359 / FGSC 10004 / NBRC 33097 / NRRL 1555) TaxID=763407 RepID=A0A167JLB9_PHYB8|nr:hypothetical protein PHYBLDRAFT_152562 [Phycomyces blakesleeanus NRRL 1555(-)]OAD66238.1 hypothetical protein PHYBLDRAFT_152562 [Phycomyces blakesleeanus NRRL 1555(-)]|eukprot:XP_018284278.1 hypothetical protein PHYBLDRAFT_152562 [Phycomyces blakesleeanus NRRL 1555(-)]
MPENPVRRTIATFVVMFASRYVVNKSAVVLIEFINKLLTIYEQDFQLPLSLPGLQRMTGFSAMTKGVKKFVVCQDCHKVYEENVSVPSHCDFVKLCVRSSCSCQLMKSSSLGALIAKRVAKKVRHWNHELKMMNTMCDIYDGAVWKELKDRGGVKFAQDSRPKEPKSEEKNYYLKPLVHELERLFVGMKIPTFECPSGANVCAALLMVACNIPAALKTSGFTSHNSTNLQNCVESKLRSEEWESASTPSERHQLESWNERCPMHNIFLGTLKRMLGWWIEEKKMSKANLITMQKTAETMVIPGKYTALTKKIGKGFLYMKTDERKSWVLVYSPVLLKGVLLPNMFKN